MTNHVCVFITQLITLQHFSWVVVQQTIQIIMIVQPWSSKKTKK